MKIHVVSPNETITSISEKYNVPASIILELNEPPNPDNLVIGQALVIRTPVTTYTVVSGDTLDSIAQSNGISVNTILQNNPIVITTDIYPGQTLVLAYDDYPNKFIIANGYTYPEIGNDLFISTMPFLTFTTIFTYGFNYDGTLVAPDDQRLIDIAINYGVEPLMLISSLTSDGTFSTELAHELFNNEELQNTLLNNIIANMKEKSYFGLDIDFEFIPPEDKMGYINFVRKATLRLNANGFICLVALAPKTSSEQPGLLYEAHDYYALGQIANLVLVMSYEWGYTYGPPLPVAPINNVEEVIRYAVTQIDPQKTLMGIPLYGYDWTLPFVRGGPPANSISPQEAILLAVKYNTNILYDEQAQAPFFYYTDSDGLEHIVWFEDARSIDAKMSLLNKYNLAGAGYWNIVRDFPQNWQVQNSTFRVERLI